MTISRTELVAAVAERAMLTKSQAAAAVEAYESAIVEAVKRREQVRLNGFITVDVVDRAERQGRNPRTGEALTIAASSAPRITPGKNLKDAAATSRS